MSAMSVALFLVLSAMAMIQFFLTNRCFYVCQCSVRNSVKRSEFGIFLGMVRVIGSVIEGVSDPPLYLDPPPPVYRYLGYLSDPPFIKTPSPLLFGTGECSETLRKSKLKRYPIKRSGITVFDIYYWVNFKKRFGKFCQGNTLPITTIEY